MSAVTVKTKSKWKLVDIDSNLFFGAKTDGLISLQELDDYEVIRAGEKSPDGDGKKAKKKKKRKSNVSGSAKKKEKERGETSPEGDNKVSKRKNKKVKKFQDGSIKSNDKSQKHRVDDISNETNNKKKKKKGNEKPFWKKKKLEKPSGRVIEAVDIVDFADIQKEDDEAKSEEENETEEAPSKDVQKKNVTKKRKQDADAESPPSKKSKSKKDQKQSKQKENKQTLPENIQQEEKTEKPDMSKWLNLFVRPEVLDALSDQGFTDPTPIQSQVLPHAVRDRLDIVAAAETGSGKTLAFGIPILNYILEQKETARIPAENDAEENEDGIEEVDQMEEDVAELDTDSDGGSDTDASTQSSPEEDGSDTDISDLGEDVMDLDGELDSPAESATDEDENEEGNGNDSENNDDFDGGFEGGSDDLEEDGDDLGEGDLDESEDDLEESEPEEEPYTDGIGCVKVIKDVDFDWLTPSISGKQSLEGRKFKPGVNTRLPLYALILEPTRELAIQVKNHLEASAIHTDIKVAVVVGGMSAQKQERVLKKGPEIVVATPGRLWELMQEGQTHLLGVEYIHHLVIDEADRMIEKGHFEELTSLFEMINAKEKQKKKRQTFVFSATLTMVHGGPQRFMNKKKKKQVTQKDKLEMLVDEIGVKAKHKVIDLTRKRATAEGLTETRITCTMDEKDLYLYYFLQRHPGRTLLFCNSKDCIRRLVSIFTLLACKPLPLHADMHQRQRLNNLDKFKGNPRGLLMATDVAARGLDIPNVQHVIHYQVPHATESYVHRSGRTARGHKEGLSVVLVGPEDMKRYRRMVQTLNRDVDLPLFPVDMEHMPAVKERVKLARQIDKAEHSTDKMKAQNRWFEKAAKEMDIMLDEEEVLNYMGDSQEQASEKRGLVRMRAHLKSMLALPMIKRTFSGKYPTMSGKLDMPFLHKPEQVDAVTEVKQEMAKKNNLQKQISNPSERKRRRRRQRLKKPRVPKPKM